MFSPARHRGAGAAQAADGLRVPSPPARAAYWAVNSAVSCRCRTAWLASWWSGGRTVSRRSPLLAQMHAWPTGQARQVAAWKRIRTTGSPETSNLGGHYIPSTDGGYPTPRVRYNCPRRTLLQGNKQRGRHDVDAERRTNTTCPSQTPYWGDAATHGVERISRRVFAPLVGRLKFALREKGKRCCDELGRGTYRRGRPVSPCVERLVALTQVPCGVGEDAADGSCWL
jgi:hypothetical protein